MPTLLTVCCTALAVLLVDAQSMRPDLYKQKRVGSAWERFADTVSAALGNCKACAPGEAMAEVARTVASGGYVSSNDPPCGDARFQGSRMPPQAKQDAAARFRDQSSGTPAYAVAFADGAPAPIRPSAPRNVYIQGQRSGRGEAANCVRLIVAMPKEARVTRVLKNLECPAGGWCGFSGEPTTEELDKDLSAIWVVAKNWSHNQPASATLQVFYRR